MSTTLTVNSLSAKFPWDLAKTTNWGTSSDNAANFSFSAKFTNGTAAGNCDLLWVDKNTLAGAASTTLTLSALTDMYGTSINFARVKAIWFEVLSDTAASGATLGGAALHPFGTGAGGLFDSGTDTLSVGNPGLIFLVKNTTTGWPVASSTSDQLKILNADGSVTLTYRLGLLGCSA